MYATPASFAKSEHSDYKFISPTCIEFEINEHVLKEASNRFQSSAAGRSRIE
jgi:hypothetical protein